MTVQREVYVVGFVGLPDPNTGKGLRKAGEAVVVYSRQEAEEIQERMQAFLVSAHLTELYIAGMAKMPVN